MMAKLAKRLNESNINVILTQSASWVNLTSALNTLRVRRYFFVFCHHHEKSPIILILGEKGSRCLRAFRHVVTRAILLPSVSNVCSRTTRALRLDSHWQRLSSMEHLDEQLQSS